jgi:outer membrane protein OmpA-like peptidoglycan-associated protein
MQSKSTLFISALAFALLAGCADNGGTKSNTQAAPAATTGTAQAGASSTAKAAPAPAPSQQAQMATLAAAADGTVAEFDKQSAELTPEALATIANTSDAAKQAQHVVVTGYCDRHDDEKNAKQIALARAGAVRTELIKHGVSAKTIRVKYVTNEARHAVTVVLN